MALFRYKRSSKMAATATRHNAENSHLPVLPVELLLLVIDQLEASDVACLAFSSKALWSTVPLKAWSTVRQKGVPQLSITPLPGARTSAPLLWSRDSGRVKIGFGEQRKRFLLHLARDLSVSLEIVDSPHSAGSML
jgi:hypothetical protein